MDTSVVHVADESSGLVATDSKLPLEEVAKQASQDIDISTQVSSHSIDNLKAFKLVYARSQLERVIKLTNYLETLEDTLIEDAIAHPDKHDLVRVIGTIQKSLSNAISLISEVTGESYMNIVFNDNTVITNPEFNTVKQTLNITDQDSRERIRKAANEILLKIKSGNVGK